MNIYLTVFFFLSLLFSVCEDPDIVLIHDAVRPLTSESVVQQVVLAAKKHGVR